MSDHHRSSYYKDSFYGSSSSKRYHSPAEAPRMGMSTGDYYDSESRSKRSRNDSYGTHTSSNRYADYSASSGTSASGSRYKAASSSASYYDLPGYKPSSSSSTSASASKYLEDYKGSSSSRSSAPKSNVRRVPPPLTPPTFSSKSSSSSIRLQPLMKVSLSSSSSGVGSSSTKDYYGSRMRQAPPEHHYSYSGSHSVSTHAKSDFKRTSTYGTSKTPSSAGYHSTARVHAGSASYRSSATASRRLIARSRAPPPNSLNSRMRGRSSLANSRREDELRKRKVVSSKSDFKRNRSGSQSHADDRSARTSTKEKKDVEENEKSHEKRQHEEEDVDYANVAEGQVVVEEVAGDDDEEGDQDDNCRTGEATTTTDVKIEVDHKDDHHKDDQSVKSNVDESKAEDKNDADEGKSTEKGSEDQEKPAATRALLKLHCPYCDVRCISFREFTFHLRSSTHVRTMSQAVSDMKRKLSKVRQEMKEDQRKREKAEKVLSDTSSYCRVCELSFRTDPKEHEANEIHNKIKALIYRRCDVCDIDFRIWKVHIYHMAALEHAKRVAMKELQEGEAKGDNVKGTNLSPEELGLDLVEIRTVFYCNACIRYIPIKGQTDDAKKNHCMTLNHLKNVEEFNEKERRRAHREEARERAKRKKQEVSEKQEKRRDTTDTIDEADRVTTDVNEQEKSADADSSSKNESGINSSIQIKQEPVDTYGEDGKTSKTVVDGQDSGIGGTSSSENQEVEGQKNMNRNEADEEDDDEIELHAGVDDVEDESEDTGDWSRRTRAGQRGDGSSN